ncbi:MAG: hypothetical protein AABX71_00960 [Nanoarchaeota archaeon]
MAEFSTPRLPLEFYMEFYSQIGINFPGVLEIMTRDFASCSCGLIGDVLQGVSITDILREILGPRRFEENPSWTIRGRYFSYNNPDMLGHRTVAHASTKDEVDKDFRVFVKYNLVHKTFS